MDELSLQASGWLTYQGASVHSEGRGRVPNGPQSEDRCRARALRPFARRSACRRRSRSATAGPVATFLGRLPPASPRTWVCARHASSQRLHLLRLQTPIHALSRRRARVPKPRAGGLKLVRVACRLRAYVVRCRTDPVARDGTRAGSGDASTARRIASACRPPWSPRFSSSSSRHHHADGLPASSAGLTRNRAKAPGPRVPVLFACGTKIDQHRARTLTW
jgi:hypothetical protein